MTTLPWSPSRRRRWWFFRGLTAVFALAFVVDGLWLRGWSDATSLLLGYAILGGITALTTWSIGRYGDIVVTASGLRVGRDRLAAADLDREWLERLATGERPVLDDRLPILGGALDVPAGWQALPVRLADGRVVAVATPDADGLLAALLAQQRGRR